MIHPEDPRAATLVGKTVYSPLFEVPVKIVADEKVDPEKGSGIVMCCTFGDLTDIEWWKTHNLPLRDIVGKDGRIFGLDRIGSIDWPSRDPASAKAASEKITGLNVRKAREAMVAALRDADLIKGEVPVVQMVPCADRSGAPLEILVSAQWVVKLLDKKQDLIRLARAMEWHPAYMEARFESWVENLKWDWGISRQRYFGVPVPFWYSKRAGEEGKILTPHFDDLPVNPLVDLPRGYTADEVEPDQDVLDTWATSSVSPQINAQGITPDRALDADRFGKLFPADLRPQAHDIIRTWAFYTVAKALLHTGQAPFSLMGISGFCLAENREKMSKSKGNGMGPAELLNQYGTDVVRYWAANYKLGHDTFFAEDVLKVGKRPGDQADQRREIRRAACCAFRRAGGACLAGYSGRPDQPHHRSLAADAPVPGDRNGDHRAGALRLSDRAGNRRTILLRRILRQLPGAGEGPRLWRNRRRARQAQRAADAGPRAAGHRETVCTVPALCQRTGATRHAAQDRQKNGVGAQTRRMAESRRVSPGCGRAAAGNAAIEALSKVRGAKSDKGVSIKTPLARVESNCRKEWFSLTICKRTSGKQSPLLRSLLLKGAMNSFMSA